MTTNGQERLILASASTARNKVLADAGVVFSVSPSTVDERAVHVALKAGEEEVGAEDLAEVLARAKAQSISETHSDALVIGGDQVLALGDQIFDKPGSPDEARTQLLALRGKTHALVSAVALARGGEVSWTHVDVAHVTLRSFSPVFLGQYMALVGPSVCDTVGCYRLEGPGVQLIERVSGDVFTVLGLPLLPLLEELRRRGILVS